MAALASDWPRHYRLFLETAEWNSRKPNRKQEFDVLYHICVFRADRKKQDGRPGLWLAETFLNSRLKPLYGIQQNLKGSKISSSYKFMFFELMSKQKWSALSKGGTLYSGARYLALWASCYNLVSNYLLCLHFVFQFLTTRWYAILQRRYIDSTYDIYTIRSTLALLDQSTVYECKTSCDTFETRQWEI